MTEGHVKFRDGLLVLGVQMHCRCNDPVSHNITPGVLTHKLPPTKKMPVLPDYSLPRSAIQKSRSDRREANSRSSVTGQCSGHKAMQICSG